MSVWVSHIISIVTLPNSFNIFIKYQKSIYFYWQGRNSAPSSIRVTNCPGVLPSWFHCTSQYLNIFYFFTRRSAASQSSCCSCKWLDEEDWTVQETPGGAGVHRGQHRSRVAHQRGFEGGKNCQDLCPYCWPPGEISLSGMRNIFLIQIFSVNIFS